MMTQYEYLQTNKYESEVQIFISCNVLYIMTQYAYLWTNKFKREVQIFISSNVLYMTTTRIYDIINFKAIQDGVLRGYDTCENTIIKYIRQIASINTAVVCRRELHCLLLGICH